ncbi:hypothetical protein DFH09DRAFT_1270787 [Mycena vulgaris]|nr:hypothetical protein DFH09DRAFT_1270787 [Mycena vulgaris]
MSVTAPSKPAIAQPVLTNGGSLFSESNGVKGGAQFSSEQQSALSQSHSMTQSNQSMQHQESSYNTMSHKESYESSYEYRGRTRLTLADCKLELKLSILTIKPKSGTEFNATTLNLDNHIGNLCGELVWGNGKFSLSSKSIHLEGTLLVAQCARDGSEPVRATLNLSEHITYSISRRCFEAILPDPAFIELMSSAGWMNVSVITQPDMRGLLASPAFQATIRSVAQRAVDEVISEMREEMTKAVQKAVAMVSVRSEEYVHYEMEGLTRRATLVNTAAYSGLGNLTLMSQEQRRAYETFAPYIGLGKGHSGEHLMSHEAYNTFAPHIAPGNGDIVALEGIPTGGNGTGYVATTPVPEATRKAPTPKK